MGITINLSFLVSSASDTAIPILMLKLLHPHQLNLDYQFNQFVHPTKTNPHMCTHVSYYSRPPTKIEKSFTVPLFQGWTTTLLHPFLGVTHPSYLVVH